MKIQLSVEQFKLNINEQEASKTTAYQIVERSIG